jgi:hypothetical protein
MISRKTSKIIADTYHACFTFRGSSGFKYNKETLYDFLYINEIDAWLLNAFKAINRNDSRGLREFIMCIHTGESLVLATQKWDWKQRQALGQRILKDIAECLIRQRHTNPESVNLDTRDKVAIDNMQKALEIDGYIYREGTLWIPEEAVIADNEEQGVLEGLMTSLRLSDVPTIKHHLELSASHYQDSRWDDSISNSRKVLEGILQQVAERHSSSVGNPLSVKELDKAVIVRDYLERSGLLERKEKDTVAQIYGLLSETGGHPYIAERDQARLMRHLSLTIAQFVLLRLEGALR